MDQWWCFQRSVIGIKHLDRGTPCEDFSCAGELVTASGAFLLMICVDGAGSASLAKRGAQLAGRAPGEVALMAAGFVATGPTSKEVAAERERIREYMTFLYSTPQYWPCLELLGFGEVGRRLHQLTREGRWNDMQGLVSDELLGLLVPTGAYDEIPTLLRERYAELATRITFPMPADPVHDLQAREVIQDLQA